MKLLYIINNIDCGGAEILLLNIISKLKKNNSNFDATVLILEDKQSLKKRFEKENITVVCTNIYKYPLLKRFFVLRKIILGISPDIVHTHLLRSDFIGLPSSYLAGVKYRISTIHNMEKKRGFHDRVFRFVTSIFATNLISVSNSARDFCIKEALYPAKKIKTIYNAPGFEATDVLAKKEIISPLKIVNVARLQEQKGQIYIIQAIKILSDRGVNCELTIFGEGPERKLLENEIKKLKLSNVILYGQSSNICNELKKADVYVSSSLWEGLPLSLIEALMMGLPTVATNIEPHKEVFNQTEDYPYLVECDSSIEIANSIEKIYKMDSSHYTQLSQKSIFLSKRFSMSEMINNYDNFYKSLLDS